MLNHLQSSPPNHPSICKHLPHPSNLIHNRNMKTSFMFLIALGNLFASTLANPLAKRDSSVCSCVTQPMCCGTNAMGVVDLNCKSRECYIVGHKLHVADRCIPPASDKPDDMDHFKKMCSKDGQGSYCCMLGLVSHGSSIIFSRPC